MLICTRHVQLTFKLFVTVLSGTHSKGHTGLRSDIVICTSCDIEMLIIFIFLLIIFSPLQHCFVIDAELWKSKFAEAQEIVKTKCHLYTQDFYSDDESSLTRSDTETPEPKSYDEEKYEEKSSKEGDKECEGLETKIQELKVDGEKSE